MKELNLIEEGSEKSTAEMEMNNSNLPDLYDLKTIEYFHKTEDKFIERINNDKIKYNLCLDHGINILYFTDISRFTNKKGLINNYFTEVITDLDTLREKILSYYN